MTNVADEEFNAGDDPEKRYKKHERKVKGQAKWDKLTDPKEATGHLPKGLKPIDLKEYEEFSKRLNNDMKEAKKKGVGLEFFNALKAVVKNNPMWGGDWAVKYHGRGPGGRKFGLWPAASLHSIPQVPDQLRQLLPKEFWTMYSALNKERDELYSLLKSGNITEGTLDEWNHKMSKLYEFTTTAKPATWRPSDLSKNSPITPAAIAEDFKKRFVATGRGGSVKDLMDTFNEMFGLKATPEIGYTQKANPLLRAQQKDTFSDASSKFVNKIAEHPEVGKMGDPIPGGWGMSLGFKTSDMRRAWFSKLAKSSRFSVTPGDSDENMLDIIFKKAANKSPEEGFQHLACMLFGKDVSEEDYINARMQEKHETQSRLRNEAGSTEWLKKQTSRGWLKEGRDIRKELQSVMGPRSIEEDLKDIEDSSKLKKSGSSDSVPTEPLTKTRKLAIMAKRRRTHAADLQALQSMYFKAKHPILAGLREKTSDTPGKKALWEGVDVGLDKYEELKPPMGVRETYKFARTEGGESRLGALGESFGTALDKTKAGLGGVGAGMKGATGAAGGPIGIIAMIAQKIPELIEQGIEVLKKIWEFMVKSSPQLQATIKLLMRGLMLFMRPFGDVIGKMLRPMARWLITLNRQAMQAGRAAGRPGSPEYLKAYMKSWMGGFLEGFKENILNPIVNTIMAVLPIMIETLIPLFILITVTLVPIVIAAVVAALLKVLYDAIAWVWGKLKEWGMNFIGGFINFGANLLPKLGAAFAGISDKIQGLKDGIASGAQKAWDALSGGVGNLKDSIVDGAKSAWGSISSAFSGFGDWLWDAITGAFEGTLNVLGDLWQWIKEAIMGALGGIGDASGWIKDKLGLASGGIAMGPTSAIIGEGMEPEAVIPLSNLQNMLDLNTGGTGTVVNLTWNQSAPIYGVRDLEKAIDGILDEYFRTKVVTR